MRRVSLASALPLSHRAWRALCPARLSLTPSRFFSGGNVNSCTADALFDTLTNDDSPIHPIESGAGRLLEWVEVERMELEAVWREEERDTPEHRVGRGDHLLSSSMGLESDQEALTSATVSSSAGALLLPRATLSAPPATATWQTRMSTSHSYLAQQDAFYLSPAPTPMEARLPHSRFAKCVMVVFAANDMRIHDNYALALAVERAETLAAQEGASGGGGIPIVAVAVVDYRTFAQPSAVGGFFRQGPARAQFFLSTLTSLREGLESREWRVPLLVRCGRPEEHIPRLALELGATDVFLTTQYAPHERKVHDSIMESMRQGQWISRDGETVCVHQVDTLHPYGEGFVSSKTKHHPGKVTRKSTSNGASRVVVVPHSVWQTTLVHYEDLPRPVAAMRDGERWYHDDVTVAPIRPTHPYNDTIARLKELPSREELLPSEAERRGVEATPPWRGNLPTLAELGYSNLEVFTVEEVIATESSHPPGEVAAIARVEEWLEGGGATALLRLGRSRRTNTKMYSQKLSRLSPYLSNGSLSPRKLYEMLRVHTNAALRDGFAQQQFREALLRLSRRDYWHWMGLRYGARLFYSYGPTPEQSDEVADWRHDAKIVQKWCAGLTGVPFADAAMRELLTTGFLAYEGRQALAWLLTRGYGQDWRLGAEWMERCSLDYDPFICYGNFAYCSELIRDDFGEPVRTIHYLAHHHDQSGIYVKKWLPQLSKIPPVYIHRPHVLTPRMQAMHGVRLGKNYPYPLKLWDGAQYTLGSAELTTYFDDTSVWHKKARNGAGGTGYAEALRHGSGILKVREWNAAVTPAYVERRPWMHYLPPSAFDDETEREESIMQHVTVRKRGDVEKHSTRNQEQQHKKQPQHVSLT